MCLVVRIRAEIIEFVNDFKLVAVHFNVIKFVIVIASVVRRWIQDLQVLDVGHEEHGAVVHVLSKLRRCGFRILVGKRKWVTGRLVYCEDG